MILKSIMKGKILHGAFKLNAILAISSKLEKLPLLSKLQIDSGTLSFMLGSACTSLAPKTFLLDPRLDEFGWTYLLHSALILGLWGTNSKSSISNRETKPKKWIAILAAFLIGTLGSAIGGYLGYHSVACKGSRWNASLPEDSLSVLAACLTASYIGGTVNFFETAKILGVTACEKKKSLLNLVAGVDIGIMVMYFWILGRLRTSFIRSLFPEGERDSSTSLQPEPLEELSEVLPSNVGSMITAYVPSILLSALISKLANLVQERTKIPGASVIFATLAGKVFIESLSYIANKSTADVVHEVYDAAMSLYGGKKLCKIFFDKVNTVGFQEAVKTVKDIALGFHEGFLALQEKARHIEKNLRTHSAQCSKYVMGLFYSTIGLSFRVDQMKAVQGPIMTLIGVTLSTHLIIVILGALLWNICVRAFTKVGSQNCNLFSNLFGIRDRINGNGTIGEGTENSNLNSDNYLIDLDIALIAR